jgi:hypothetical protein
MYSFLSRCLKLIKTVKNICKIMQISIPQSTDKSSSALQKKNILFVYFFTSNTIPRNNKNLYKSDAAAVAHHESTHLSCNRRKTLTKLCKPASQKQRRGKMLKMLFPHSTRSLWFIQPAGKLRAQENEMNPTQRRERANIYKIFRVGWLDSPNAFI